MVSYHFHPAAPLQPTVLEWHDLTANEYAAIDAIVRRDNPSRWVDSIVEVHGRGIILQSPTFKSTIDDYLAGNFDGLQIIGGGGNTMFVHDGPLRMPNEVLINLVDEANHAMTLQNILEQRTIDSSGIVRASTRHYAPLHGMDIAEAQKRRTHTDKVNDAASVFIQEGKNPSFIGPRLAAYGHFPDKLDPDGNPLHFQVYRVPLQARAPAQLLKLLTDTKLIKDPGNDLSRVSYLMGASLRTFHSMGFAYMQPHLGNVSLIKSIEKSILYTTDLGSMVDISNSHHARRYMGLDAYVYLKSTAKYLDSVLVFFGARERDPSGSDNWLRERVIDISNSFVCGYFFVERQQEGMKKRLTDFALSSVLSNIGKTPQQFVQSFENMLYAIAKAQ